MVRLTLLPYLGYNCIGTPRDFEPTKHWRFQKRGNLSSSMSAGFERNGNSRMRTLEKWELSSKDNTSGN
jgi:hypothetical protein